MIKFFVRVNVLCLIMVCLSQNILAQNYFDGKSYTITLDQNKLDYGGIEFRNDKSYPLVLSWVKLDEDTVSGSRFDMCANSECYIGVPDTGSNSSFPVLPNDTGFFKLHYWTGGFSGTSTIKLYVFEQSSPKDGDTLIYTLNISSISTGFDEDMDKNSPHFNIYPIPVSTRFTLESKYEKVGDDCFLYLVDALGRTVLSQNIEGLKYNTLDVGNIECGVYTLHVVDDQQTIYTNKIIINRK